jgi:hypothetical protein
MHWKQIKEEASDFRVFKPHRNPTFRRAKNTHSRETVRTGSVEDPHCLSIRILIQGAKPLRMHTDPSQTSLKSQKVEF